MYSYPVERLNAIISEIIQSNISPEVSVWLAQQVTYAGDKVALNKAFVLIPRKTRKTSLSLSTGHLNAIQQIRPGLTITGYTIDRLSRLWFLLQLDSENQKAYHETIEHFFVAADMNELVALYGALPVLAYPQAWKSRCAEGIRSNIGAVLEAIICDNPYPCEYLDDNAWNQLVLKAFFTEKPIDRIIGLDRRANKALADTLCDYAHERWSASRPVHPALWRCVAPFIHAGNFSDIQKVVSSKKLVEQQAAILACYHSNYEPAKALLKEYPHIYNDIKSGTLSWQSLVIPEPTPL